MTHDQKEDELDILLAAARRQTPSLSEEKLEQIVAAVPVPRPIAKPAAKPGFSESLSGWLPALGGLGAATAVGVWVGLVAPITGLLEGSFGITSDPFDLSTFYTGADPALILMGESDT